MADDPEYLKSMEVLNTPSAVIHPSGISAWAKNLGFSSLADRI